MSRKTTIMIALLVVVVFLGGLLLTGCSNMDNKGQKDNQETVQQKDSTKGQEKQPTVGEKPTVEEKLTIKDMFGRDVTVPQKVERVVVVGGVLNHMNWLQVEDRVVGVEEIETRPDEKSGGRVYRWAFPSYASLPSIGPAARPDAEMILSAAPEVVFFASLTQDAVENLQSQLTLPVVGLLYPEFSEERDNFYKQLRLVAKIMDREERGEELIGWINKSLTDLSQRASLPDTFEKPSCYVGGILQGPEGTGLTSTMPYYPPFVMLEVKNVISPADLGLLTPGTLGRYTVDIEFLVSKNPDYIFIDRAGTGPTKMQYENNKDVLRHVNAIAKENVYGLLPWHAYNNNVETMFINAYFIGKVIYPHKFTDIDPIKKAEEVYQFWYGNSVYNNLSNALGGGLNKFDF